MRFNTGGQPICAVCDEPLVRVPERDYAIGLTRFQFECPDCGRPDLTLVNPRFMRRSPAGNPAPAVA